MCDDYPFSEEEAQWKGKKVHGMERTFEQYKIPAVFMNFWCFEYLKIFVPSMERNEHLKIFPWDLEWNNLNK